MKLATEAADVSMDELEQPLERVREPLGEDDYRKLKAAVNTFRSPDLAPVNLAGQ